MLVQLIEAPEFTSELLMEDESPALAVDSAAERAWVPAYAAALAG
ncbi:hypothetical protein N4G70_19800 [Streptomyces sp. ASQP_92]|nr:hypothetical protein [Streptomyces sp. ASQP_92]MCT9091086.1 hypothetical protein [Streptomyces sp. ASQP_92]